ncbi:MAG TPA: ABC transporter permease [Cryptosporangiaceae bacterium]|nr:ABC transporter permease [Cryptosporangiaceae bacterium]
MSVDATTREHEADLAGLDALQVEGGRGRTLRRWRDVLWSGTWPKVAAVLLALIVWEIVVLTGWRPEYVLPSPFTVGAELVTQIQTPELWAAVATTMQRALFGFGVATVIGLALGFAVARFTVLRAAVGSMITGLQTMPSIAWFPLAIVLFGLDESAIFFVVVLGAAPSIANGVLAGVDYVPPLLVRAGRNMGASGISLYRHVIGPASMPAIVGGLKQGWAFSWRSLMAGELLVRIGESGSLGARLQDSREVADYPALLVTMILVLVIGILADAAFTAANNALRRRWGLLDAPS